AERLEVPSGIGRCARNDDTVAREKLRTCRRAMPANLANLVDRNAARSEQSLGGARVRKLDARDAHSDPIDEAGQHAGMARELVAFEVLALIGSSRARQRDEPEVCGVAGLIEGLQTQHAR